MCECSQKYQTLHSIVDKDPSCLATGKLFILAFSVKEWEYLLGKYHRGSLIPLKFPFWGFMLPRFSTPWFGWGGTVSIYQAYIYWTFYLLKLQHLVFTESLTPQLRFSQIITLQYVENLFQELISGEPIRIKFLAQYPAAWPACVQYKKWTVIPTPCGSTALAGRVQYM